MYTVDISNYTGTLTPAIVGAWQAQGVEHVVVRLSLENPALQEVAQQQIAQCRAAGIAWISGYIWCYFRYDDPATVIAQTLATYPGLTAYFLDVEDRQAAWPTAAGNVAWLRQAVRALQDATVRYGIYTAPGLWNTLMGGSTAFAGVPLWVASWDGVADLDRWPRFGGWTWVAGKQYAGNGQLGGVAVDHNLFWPPWVQAPWPPVYRYPFRAEATYQAGHWDGALAVDVFDAEGAPILACTAGVAHVHDYPLGGHTVTLQGIDGYWYYYAHLVPGSGVAGWRAAGEVVGAVGTSGNAAGKPPHCHFAIGSLEYGIDAQGAGDQPPWEWLDAWRAAPAPAPAPPAADCADLINLLGYLQGDVADALAQAGEHLYRARRATAREAAWTAFQAALHTLRTAGRSDPASRS